MVMMMKIITVLFFIGILLFLPGNVLAIDDDGATSAGCDPSVAGIDLGSCITLGKDGQSVADVYKQPSDLINPLVRNIFIVAGIIIFFMIIYSAFQFLEKDAKGIDEAKSIMTSAMLGLVIMFVAYWLVRIISVVTGMNLLPF